MGIPEIWTKCWNALSNKEEEEGFSTNAMTGFEVDAQRNKAVNDYILEINK